MKERLKIGELAKLKGITTETLRHYDRVGLLKPVIVDQETNYRYYSIVQYEKLSTILELRQLGMSIEEMKEYFENRSVERTSNLLKQHHTLLKEKIQKMQQIEKILEKKIAYLEEVTKIDTFDTFFYKELSERTIVTSSYELDSEDMNMWYSCMKVENMIEDIAPLLATCNYGTIFSKEVEQLDKATTFILVDDLAVKEEEKKVLKGGLYACQYFRYEGLFLSVMQNEVLKRAKESWEICLKKDGYEIIGDCLVICEIDINITNNQKELLYQLQIPIQKNKK